jgi:pimeloyl-ACP methyl ester carboxylesterase
MLAGAQSRTKWSAAEVARVSTETTYIVAENSGHWIQLDEPEIVVDAVREMVMTVLKKSRTS